MTDEQGLVGALSIASTLSVGLSVDPTAGVGRLERGPPPPVTGPIENRI